MEIEMRKCTDRKGKEIYPGMLFGWVTHYFCLNESDLKRLSETDATHLIELQLRESLENSIKDLRKAVLTTNGKPIFKNSRGGGENGD